MIDANFRGKEAPKVQYSIIRTVEQVATIHLKRNSFLLTPLVFLAKLRLAVVRLCISAVPPRELIVLDEYGQRQVDVLGPYNEGATVLLVCEVEGGERMRT